MLIRYKKLHPQALAPAYKTPGAVGADLACTTEVVCPPGVVTLLPLGVAIELPEGHVGLLLCRSSLPVKRGLLVPNGAGVIDPDYRGEWFLQVMPVGSQPVTVAAGERVAQMLVVPARTLAGGELIDGFTEAETLTDTARGAGAFGSTGVG